MPDEIKNEPDTSQQGGVNVLLTPEEVDYSNVRKQTFYANHGSVAASLFDMRLIFNYIEGVDATTNKLTARENLTVLMSPELALLVCSALAKAVQEYTQKFGPVRPAPAVPRKLLEPSIAEGSATRRSNLEGE